MLVLRSGFKLFDTLHDGIPDFFLLKKVNLKRKYRQRKSMQNKLACSCILELNLVNLPIYAFPFINNWAYPNPF